MKFSVISDTHAQHLRDSELEAKEQMQRIDKDNPEFIIHLGDIGEGRMNPAYNIWFNHNPNTYFVVGNHDLWNYLPPDLALTKSLGNFKYGHPLEKQWDDRKTFYQHKNVAIVGTIGFPDFKHPAPLKEFGKNYDWDNRSATNDPRFIDLTKGWLTYTERLHSAFFARLAKAFKTDADFIIVAAHYAFLESHSLLDRDPREMRIWPYFFNYTIGQKVLELAKANPDKKVLAIAGHSHEFCKGKLLKELDNVWSYGFKTVYGELPHVTFDLGKEISIS